MPIGFVDVLWRNLTGHYFWIKFVAPRELKRATSLGEKRNSVNLYRSCCLTSILEFCGNSLYAAEIDLGDDGRLAVDAPNLADVVVGSSLLHFLVEMGHRPERLVGSYT